MLESYWNSTNYFNRYFSFLDELGPKQEFCIEKNFLSLVVFSAIIPFGDEERELKRNRENRTNKMTGFRTRNSNPFPIHPFSFV